MFAVLFEVNPDPDRWDDYLGRAALLRPELERIDGFVENIRYRSLTRDGWILSLSTWRDEKSLVRWRTRARHHDVQQQGRDEILAGYRLRVGQLTGDTHLPAGHELLEQRLDETAGTATTVEVATARHRAEEVTAATAPEVASWLGLVPDAAGLVAWDVFDAVLEPGDVVLMTSWKDHASARAHEAAVEGRRGTRRRRVRVVRDYGLADRYEAPQYYPDVTR
ncbi:antibiotic biosynthesis monooxygenase [Actinomycetospora sp. TBRC 11914]|uniref:antibiotic biosynthesis monooxygenase family protein n=1 Tax=Actinomycetospora sp. TBRC 11914 TaxID=2729387 RepID=UPI00145C9C52|nr:antibiotic biosynthesis monooxygenase [Actinomycetospora sp. TBRC 11914]NMO91719.1 antibiotic biosynthesis monooxygenase [Actinomycetospora sp. TBRC 11914]